MKYFAYVRISTTGQDQKAQELGIKKYFEIAGINQVTWVKDTISGSISWESRGLKNVLDQAESGDFIVVSELSRIGRSTADVLTFLRIACEKGLSIYAIKNNIMLDNSIQSTIFATVMALAAEIERDFIRSRTKEGMEKAKLNGVKIGRPKGSTGVKKLDKVGDQVAQLHAAGVAKTAIAKVCNVSRGTVDRYLKQIK